jgi:hypothetical protein
MKRVTRATLLAVLITAQLLFSCRPSYRTFTTQIPATFSFKYPASFTLKTSDSNETSCHVEITDGNAEAAQSVWITVDAYRHDEKTPDAATALSTEMANVSIAADNSEVTEEIHASVAGRPAGGVAMHYSIGMNIIFVRAIFFDSAEGIIYSVHVGSPPEKQDNAKDIFNRVLETFRIGK